MGNVRVGVIMLIFCPGHLNRGHFDIIRFQVL